MEPTINEILRRWNNVLDCTDRLGGYPGEQMIKMGKLVFDRNCCQHKRKHRRLINKQIRQLAKESGLIE
jgi:hypothetical protein